MDRTGQNTQRDMDNFNLENQTSIEQLKSIFMMIYQVRCNLEHGQKSPTGERDILLCKHSSLILEMVLIYKITQGLI